MSFGVRLRVWGDMACFTRPEMKAERVSYDVMTPSAARGVVEAIYWKPQIRWIIDRIHVLKPIRFTNLRRNEVGGKVPVGSVESVMNNGRGQLGVYVEEDRQQRAATLLRDVEYFIEAHFEVIDPRDTDGTPLTPTQAEAKHLDQFNRRARAGQCFQRPYLGCREFPAQFELIEEEPPRSRLAGTPEGNRDLGYMLHDIDFARGMAARFFRANMVDGVIDVPPPESAEVRS